MTASPNPGAGGAIVVPTHPSVFTWSALRVARALAHETGATLHLFSMRPEQEPAPRLARRFGGPVRADEAGVRFLDQLVSYVAGSLGPYRVYAAQVTARSWSDSLAAYVRESRAAMVVVGEPGSDALACLGAVGEVPVLVVREGEVGEADVEIVSPPRPPAA